MKEIPDLIIVSKKDRNLPARASLAGFQRMLKTIMHSALMIFSGFVVMIMAGCHGGSDADSHDEIGDEPAILMEVSSDFESGSSGLVERSGANSWNIYLSNDNDNDQLPASYRNWWYVQLDNVAIGENIKISLRNRGWLYYYLPVYSYDQQTWFRFNEEEVRLGVGCEQSLAQCTLEISTSRFSESRVFLARFYPYTTENLSDYLLGLVNNPFVSITTLGYSDKFGIAIPLLRIEDPAVPDNEKRAVWMQARSHPAETGSSFLVEGAVRQLLDDLGSGLEAARHLVYYIAPLHNADGVFVGNYRTDTSSRNLENQWIPEDNQAVLLSTLAPRENQLLNEVMIDLAYNSDYVGDLLALNLHSSNSPVDTPAFAFPHFGDDPRSYNEQERSLWNKQLRLLAFLSFQYDGRFSPPPVEGGREFLNYHYPETWWWRNMGDRCMAITIETVYSKGGFDHYVTETDIRDLGAAMTRSIYDYYSLTPTLRDTLSSSIGSRPIRSDLPDEIESKQ